MIAEVGLAALTLAFALAVYAVFACAYGARMASAAWVLSGRNAALLTFPAALVATGALVAALMMRAVSTRLRLQRDRSADAGDLSFHGALGLAEGFAAVVVAY